MKKSPEYYLKLLGNQMCEKIVVPTGKNLLHDRRFDSTKEMQSYNEGIAECMHLVSQMLDSEDFRSDLSKMLD